MFHDDILLGLEMGWMGTKQDKGKGSGYPHVCNSSTNTSKIWVTWPKQSQNHARVFLGVII